MYWLHLSFWWLLKHSLNSQRCFWTIELCTWVWCPHFVRPCINAPLKGKKSRGNKSLWKEKKKKKQNCDVSPWIILWNKKELTTSHSYASCKSQGMTNISSCPIDCPVAITTAFYSSSTAWKGHHWSAFFLSSKILKWPLARSENYFTKQLAKQPFYESLLHQWHALPSPAKEWIDWISRLPAWINCFMNK